MKYFKILWIIAALLAISVASLVTFDILIPDKVGYIIAHILVALMFLTKAFDGEV